MAVTGKGTEGQYTLNKIQVYALLEHIHPTLPIEVADCEAVRDLIAPVVPSDLTIDVMHDGKGIHVKLHDRVPECVFALLLYPQSVK